MFIHNYDKKEQKSSYLSVYLHKYVQEMPRIVIAIFLQWEYTMYKLKAKQNFWKASGNYDINWR